MTGMLPGVECARKRRFHFHQRGAPFSNSPTTHNNSTRRFSIGLHYTSNFESLLSSASSLERSQFYNKAHPDDNLGGAAREAKQRLDERFRAQRESENKRSNRKRKHFSTWFMAPTQILMKLEESSPKSASDLFSSLFLKLVNNTMGKSAKRRTAIVETWMDGRN